MDALKILNIISDNGFEAYIIGGYPRDLYLGKISSDVDITTSATYEELKNIFDDIKYRNFGSMILNFNNKEYEITTFRKEFSYTKSRFPKKVEFVKDLQADLKRRDFIINTLCIDKNGEFIDLLGAKNDIDNKIIRSVGDNDYKIKQDVLRSLRAIRFSCKLNFEIEPELKNTIKKYNYLLKELSKERINKELCEIEKYEKGKELLIELDLIDYLRR